VGGLSLLKAFAGPFPDVAFCPTGGITRRTAPQFLKLPNVKVCGGSWLTPPMPWRRARLGAHHATGAGSRQPASLSSFSLHRPVVAWE
jgi:2-keto-3-deoxy-6-phosphogluconate aldolase